MKKHKDIISFKWVPSQEQLADLFTKPLSPDLHDKFTLSILGWNPSHTPNSHLDELTVNVERECDNIRDRHLTRLRYTSCEDYTIACSILYTNVFTNRMLYENISVDDLQFYAHNMTEMRTSYKSINSI